MHRSFHQRRLTLRPAKAGFVALLALISACAAPQASSTRPPSDAASTAPAEVTAAKPTDGAANKSAEDAAAKPAANAIAKPAGADGAAWFQKLMAREIELPANAVEYKSAKHAGSVLSAGPLQVERAEAATYVVVPVGDITPFQCYFYDEAREVAATISELGPYVVELLGKSQGGVEAAQLASIDAGVFGAIPFLHVTWVYRLKGSGAGPVVGTLKQTMITTDHQTTLCQHNEPGYEKTFRKWMAHLAGNYQHDDGPVHYRLLEVSKDELNGNPVGVSVVRMVEDGDGGFQRETTAAFLGRRGSEVLAMDKYIIEFTDADGLLVRGVYVDTRGMALSVERAKTGYAVTGKHAGKDVEFALETPSPVCTATRVERELAKMLRVPGQQTFACDTFFSGSPDKLVQIKATEREAVDPMAVQIEMGPLSLTSFYDGPDKPVSTEMTAGPATVKSVMVYREGRP